MKKSPILKFTSEAFAIAPGEDEATNPGIFGKALAEWIREQLRASGLSTSAIVAEDFGWCVPIASAPYSLYVACGGGPSTEEWHVFAFVEGGLIHRLFGQDRSDELLATLFSTLQTCLQSSSIVQGLTEEANA